MTYPDCENPVLLINQQVLSYVYNGAKLVLSGGDPLVIPPYMVNDFDWHGILRKYLGKDEQILDSCYCQISDGRQVPLFMYAACGKCLCCRHSKQVDLVNRAILEGLSYEVPPFFFTLTYDQKNIPSNYQLRYKDVQDFFKRLRVRWERKGYNVDCRYLVSGEYGSRFGRPHYHVILWNNPLQASMDRPDLYNQLRQDIFDAWSKCDIRAFDFGQCVGGAANYATKYVCKPYTLRKGQWIKPFVHASCGNGGLGSRYIDKHKSYYIDNPGINYIEYLNNNGVYSFMYMSKSISRRIFPSPLALVPPVVKTRYKEICEIISQLVYFHELPSSEAIDLCNELIPYPGIMRSRYSGFEFPDSFKGCPTLHKFMVQRLYKLFRAYLDDFEVKLVDKHYIAQYNLHMDNYLDRQLPTADKIRKISEKYQVIRTKELF